MLASFKMRRKHTELHVFLWLSINIQSLLQNDLILNYTTFAY